MDFKEKLKIAMSAKGYTISELSAKSGVSKGIISKYLKGYTIPKSNNIYRLALALEVSPAAFFDFENEENSKQKNLINKIMNLTDSQIEDVNKFIDTFILNIK